MLRGMMTLDRSTAVRQIWPTNSPSWSQTNQKSEPVRRRHAHDDNANMLMFSQDDAHPVTLNAKYFLGWF